MITETLIDLLLKPVLLLLDAMPVFSVSFPSVVFDPLVSIINTLGYVVPVKALLPILLISSLLKTAQILWAFIIRVKSFIPTMGD